MIVPVRAEQMARDLRRGLVGRGQRRAVAVPDLLVAATAQAAGLTVLRCDGDFDLIASITLQQVEWIVEAGTAD
ncbi:MAG: hypothetical protein ACRD0K_02250 [Egibacteraceae bacterium]